MLKKMGRTSIAGIFRWKIELRMAGCLPDRVHRHVELTEAAAQKLYAELIEQKARARSGLAVGVVRVSSITLGEACAKYEQELYTTKKNASHINGVLLSLRILRELLGDTFPLANVSQDHVRRWREKRQATVIKTKYQPKGRLPGPSTINKSLVHLSGFFAFCCDGWIDTNPAVFIKRVKQVDPPLRILSWKDFTAYADKAWACSQEYGLLVEVLGESGARIDETLRAKVGDVNLFRKTWKRVVKPGKTIVVDAGPWVLHAATGRKATEPLCPSGSVDKEGAPLPFTYAIVKRKFKGAGFTPHWIRHGRACWDLIEGKTLFDVKEKLGHSSTAVTERYLKAAKQLEREEEPKTVHARPVALVTDRVAMCGKAPDNGPVLAIVSSHGPQAQEGAKSEEGSGVTKVS